ncbi:MAG: helix-turn-helix transcriptional regulator [Armatimonadetes bacterium]|nr:helix-turn-helix transcriptional regulator [Armatimonadota bacterium]
MSHLEKVIGQKIREVRHNSHLTQEAFAEEIQVHPSYIGPMEKGRKRPSIRTLIRISERFEVPIYEFFLNGEAAKNGPLLELNLMLSQRNRADQQMVLDLAKSLMKNLERKPMRAIAG